MKKMKTLFAINRSKDLATEEIQQGCEWISDKGVEASVKIEGTAAFFKDGILFKRYDRKLKKKFAKMAKNKKAFNPTLDMFKDVPDNAIACEKEPDPISHHWPHWIPVTDSPEDKHFQDALNLNPQLENNCSYELIGEKVQHNMYNLQGHKLVKHGDNVVTTLKSFSFASIKEWLKENEVEGLVFKHPDGRMCKVRRKDMFDFKNLTNGRKVIWLNDNLIL